MRISATLVDSYMLWREVDWKPEQELIDSIKGVFRESWQMRHGKALHRILEVPEECVAIDGYRSHGVLFDNDDIQQCLACFDRRGVFEVKHTKDYVIDGEAHTIVTKADQLIGTTVVENKSKWSQFDIDSYFRAYQPRFYLDSFQANTVRYNVFCFNKKADESLELKSIESFNLYPYPNLHRDCVEAVAMLVDYVKSKGLESYLAADRYERAA